jgi:hypothetical protein
MKMNVFTTSLVYTILIVAGIAAIIGVMFGLAWSIVWLLEAVGKVWLAVGAAALIFMVVLIVNYFNN